MSGPVFMLIINIFALGFVIAIPFIIIGIIKYLIRYYVRYKDSYHENNKK